MRKQPLALDGSVDIQVEAGTRAENSVTAQTGSHARIMRYMGTENEKP
jgi:hypothetical protein